VALNFTVRRNISLYSETFCKLGKNRLRVLLLAWLTLFPLWTVRPVKSQRRAIAINPKFGVDSGVAALRREVLSEQEIAVKVKANHLLKKHSKVFARQWLEPSHRSRLVFQDFEF
ncbi:uncharacterized protein METZ01_LOCUS356845, partial [marine metagenome]